MSAKNRRWRASCTSSIAWDRPYRTHALFLGEAGTGKMAWPGCCSASCTPKVGPASAASSMVAASEMETSSSAAPMARPVFQGPRWALILDEVLALSPHLWDACTPRLAVSAGPSSSQCVTVLAMSDGDVEAAVASGSFRHDLYYKLCRLVPARAPLRDRKDDLGHAAVWMANRVLRDRGQSRPAELFDPAAEAPCRRQAPTASRPASTHCAPRGRLAGNFRELESVIERAILLLQRR